MLFVFICRLAEDMIVRQVNVVNEVLACSRMTKSTSVARVGNIILPGYIFSKTLSGGLLSSPWKINAAGLALESRVAAFQSAL